jgi:hypothetical protein
MAMIKPHLGRGIKRLAGSGAHIYGLFGLAGFLFFWREILSSKFNLIPGNGDARLAHTILEHWFNVFSGHGDWRSPESLFPVRGVLGFTDTYFLYGLLYSLCRLSLDAFDSFQLLVMSLVLFSYIGMCVLLRVVLGLRPAASAFGGVIFAYSSLNASRLGHVQLLISFAYPLLLLCAWSWFKSFTERVYKGLFLGSLGAILLAASLFTSFNAIWFFCLFSSIWLVVAAVFQIAYGRSERWSRKQGAPSDALASRLGMYVGIPLVVFAVCLAPFILVYGPMVKAGYGSSYEEMSKNLPRLVDLINVGPFNQTWGQLLPRAFPSISSQRDAGFYEHALGFPLAFLAVFLMSFGSCVSRRLRGEKVGSGRQAHDVLILITGMAIFISWLLLIRWGPHSPWRAVMAVIPGAHGVRAVFRFQVVLYFFSCTVVAVHLDRMWRAPLNTAWRKCLAAGLPLIMMAEQTSHLYAEIDKTRQRATFARVGAPPAECKLFYVERSNVQRAPFEVAIDAMYVSVFHRLPTINGYNGQGPVNYSVAEPNSAAYDILVAEWLVRHRLLDGICSLDLDAGNWKEIHPSGAVPRGVNLLTPDPMGVVPDRMWIGLQRFAGVGLTNGQWTTGNSTVVFARPEVVEELEFSFQMPREEGGMLKVFVDDWPTLSKRFSKGDHHVRLPLHKAVLSVRIESDRISLGKDRFHVFRELGIHLNIFMIR